MVQTPVNIVFSETIDSQYANVIGNYFIEGLEVKKAVLLSDRKTVSLQTTPQDTITYKLTIYNITDLEGRRRSLSGRRFHRAQCL